MNTTRKPLTTTILAGLMLLVMALNALIPATPAAAQVPAPLNQESVIISGASQMQTTGNSPNEVQAVCDQAQFVADVTVQDGTRFTPGASFTKTWRLKNTGTCTWTRDYDLVFYNGSRMGGARAIALSARVRPGRTADLTVELTAPQNPGEYTGRWMLRNADGELFGIGKNNDKPFWVNVKVVKPAKMFWDMEKDTCQATWSTSALFGLSCLDANNANNPNDPNSPNENTGDGYIKRDAAPVLENGRHENEAALITYPNAGKGGFIQGQFPAYTVKDGDHFRAIIGCLEDSQGCKVTFQLSYRTKNGRVRTLATWREKYDEKIQKIDVDLSELAGREIQLVLTVFSLDDNTNDRAFWLRPSIWR